MPRREICHREEQSRPSDDRSADKILTKPVHQQTIDHDRQRFHRDHPRRKRSCDKNSKQQPKKQRPRKRNWNEKNIQKNQGQTASKNAQSADDTVDDISVVPTQEQKHNEHHRPRRTHQRTTRSSDEHVKLVPKDQRHSNTVQNKRSRKKNQRQKKRKQQHQVSTATNRESGEKNYSLEWDSPIGYVPLGEEEFMVQTLFKENGKRERGMLREVPSSVVSNFRRAMEKHTSMNFPQVSSLRRHHIKLFSPLKNMAQLGLGKNKFITKSALRFECAVEAFLEKSCIEFLTEKDQQRKANKEKKILKATPDFVLPKPVLLRKTQYRKSENGKATEKYRHVLEERTIHWIEVKMFYGASSIPHGSKGAVGSVLATAQKYVEYFGEGAIVFMMGCGEKLAAEINDIGVSVLDCSGNTVSLDEVHDHQRIWCADANGQILP